MKTATTSYVVMLLALCGGLWFILGTGASLLAPTAIGGVWESTTEPGADHAPRRLLIEQSGQFVSFALPDGRRLDVRLKSEESAGEGDARVVTLSFGPPTGERDAFRVMVRTALGTMKFIGLGPELDRQEWRLDDPAAEPSFNH